MPQDYSFAVTPRVDQAKERIAMTYAGKTPDQLPFSYFVAGFESSLTTPERFTDDEQALLELLAGLRFQMEHFPDSDYVPVLKVDFGQVLVPSMVGVDFVIPLNNQPWSCEPGWEDMDMVLEILEQVDVCRDGLGPRVLERTSYFVKETRGLIPIAVTDVQSPLGLAAKLLGNTPAMLGVLAEPDHTRELLLKLAEIIVATIKAQIEAAGDASLLQPHMWHYVPGDFQGMLYDDFISVISPTSYRDVCAEANAKVFTALGGGHLHTCGPIKAPLTELLTTPGLRSFDTGFVDGMTQTTEDILSMKRQCAGKIPFYISRFSDFTRVAEEQGWSGEVVSDAHNLTPEWFAELQAGGGVILQAGGSIERGHRYRRMIAEAAATL